MLKHSLNIGVLFLLLLGLVLSSGCSRQDFSYIPTPGWTRRESGATGPSEDRLKNLENVLVDWQAHSKRDRSDYQVGPDDELEVQIFALEHPGENSTYRRTIAKDGTIVLPWVGSLKIAGMNLRQIEEFIRQAYGGKYLKNPQVGVNMLNYSSVAVVVTGAVGQPGIYYLTSNKSTILEVLAKAGGLNEDSGDELLLISENIKKEDSVPALKDGLLRDVSPNEAPEKKIIPIDIARLIDNGDFRLNHEVGAGDIITVRPRAQQVVYVLGYVQRPGAFELKPGQRLDALKGVALAGGLGPSARAENSYLIRETEQGQRIIPMNLTKMAGGSIEAEHLQPGDTLVVGSGFMARLAEFVKPGVTAGMSYTPTP